MRYQRRLNDPRGGSLRRIGDEGVAGDAGARSRVI